MAILIVDDSEDSRNLLLALLKTGASGEEIIMTASAAEAFERLGLGSLEGDNPEGYNKDVNLILMDITMPEMNGVEACRVIKAVQEFENLPIIMVSGNEEVEFLDQAFASGAVDYITKPVNRIELWARVRSALTLKREVDRRKEAYAELSKQFLHAQKLESVGRLAGGLAHDFNNMMTPILGYTQMGLRDFPAGSRINTNFKEILKAAEHASGLARQLLRVSRHQGMEPKVVDLNELIAGLKNMLQRMVGEDIKFEVIQKPDLGLVKVDPDQLEQVLMNLVVNARDAVSSGCRITLSTDNFTLDRFDAAAHRQLAPGRYVTLAVSDDGVGIPPEVQERIFEPFFTTKEEGKGTGLGLATSDGIVRQSGGCIEVSSELGTGTTFTIYLPLVEGPLDRKKPSYQASDPLPGTETVLLAEDEPLVRTMIAEILRDQGYSVLEAGDGQEAMQLAQENNEQQIRLLVTDIVMPNMGGIELAKQFHEINNAAGVLFISGYTEENVLDQKGSGMAVDFLQKPFQPVAFTRAVRGVLDR